MTDTPRDYPLGGWSVTLEKLEAIAQALHATFNCDVARLQSFFAPMLDKDVKFNYSELLAKLFDADPALLAKIINLQENNQYVFENIHEYIDFVLGAKHFREPSMAVYPALLANSTDIIEVAERPYSDKNTDSGIIVAYNPNRIILSTEQLQNSFLRLLALQLTLQRDNKGSSLLMLKEMITNGIPEDVIIRQSESIPNPIELRLATVFPDLPGRQTVLCTISTEDPHSLCQYTRTYLHNDGHEAQQKNIEYAQTLYAYYNVTFKVVSNTAELFSAITVAAQKNPNNKLPFALLNGHGLHLGGPRMLGLVLNRKHLRHGVFSDKTEIPANVFDPLENGILVFKCCNRISRDDFASPVVQKIGDNIGINMTIVAPTSTIQADSTRLSVDPSGRISVSFIKNGEDITYTKSHLRKSQFALTS